MGSKDKHERKDALELSVILPTYNEAQNIEPVIQELNRFFSEKKMTFEIIVVDDSSPDGTASRVEKVQKTIPNLVLIKDCPKEGIGKALQRGYNAAQGKWLLSMDADRAFRTEEIERFLLQQNNGFDFITGSKYLKESSYAKESVWALIKSKISEYGNAYISLASGVPLHDFSMNFRLLKKNVWQDLNPTDNENFFLVEMLVQSKWKGYSIKEIGVSLLPRDYGASKTRVWKQSLKFLAKSSAFWLQRLKGHF